MKILLLEILCVLVIISCSELEIAWTKKIDFAGIGDYHIADINRMDKRTFIVGTYQSDTLRPQCFVAAFDTNDILIWHALYQDPEQRAILGRSVIVERSMDDLTGKTYCVYVHARLIRANKTTNSLIVKYDENGTLIWDRVCDSRLVEDEKQSELYMDYTGALYLIGCKWTSDHSKAVFLKQYDSQGICVASSRYPLAQVDTIVTDVAAPDRIVFAGVRGNNRELFFARYAGQEQGFFATIVPVQGNFQSVADVSITKEGFIYLVGAVHSQDNAYDYLTSCYADNDSLLWQQTFCGPMGGDDIPVALCIDDSMNVYVVGTSETRDDKTDIVTVKYDSSGQQLWSRSFVGREDESARAYCLQRYETPFHEDYLYIYGTVDNDALVVRYNRNGYLTWFTRIQYHTATCLPTAQANHMFAVKTVADGAQEALLIKYQRVKYLGIKRWD